MSHTRGPWDVPAGHYAQEWWEAGAGNGIRLEPTAYEPAIRLRLALTQARDALERHRDPLVREIDKVLGQ